MSCLHSQKLYEVLKLAWIMLTRRQKSKKYFLLQYLIFILFSHIVFEVNILCFLLSSFWIIVFVSKLSFLITENFLKCCYSLQCCLSIKKSIWIVIFIINMLKNWQNSKILFPAPETACLKIVEAFIQNFILVATANTYW